MVLQGLGCGRLWEERMVVFRNKAFSPGARTENAEKTIRNALRLCDSYPHQVYQASYPSCSWPASRPQRGRTPGQRGSSTGLGSSCTCGGGSAPPAARPSAGWHGSALPAQALCVARPVFVLHPTLWRPSRIQLPGGGWPGRAEKIDPLLLVERYGCG